MEIIFNLNERQEKAYKIAAQYLQDKNKEDLIGKLVHIADNMQWLGGSSPDIISEAYRFLAVLHFYHLKTQTNGATQHANQSDYPHV